MTWYWITEREKPEPMYDWQSREPVSTDAKKLICAAWKDYDNSDANYDGITHEEAVLAGYCSERIFLLHARNLITTEGDCLPYDEVLSEIGAALEESK